MSNKNLDDVIENFSDGPLTKREFQNLMGNIGKNRDYLSSTDYDRLIEQVEKEGVKSLTKYQFVQCRETAIFKDTGVTRD